MKKCKKGVVWKDSVSRYYNNGLVNILKLGNSIENETYKIDDYYKFTIYEPKKREIVSTKFKDRVFQRSLTDNYLYDEITNSFIYDNGACQIGKGTDYAMDRLSCHMQRYFRKYGLDGFVLKIDMKDYFGSTPHCVAKATLRYNVNDKWTLSHTDKIIDSFDQGKDPDIGMGLGSQITQLTQLAVLDKLDHYIKEELKVKYYIRYMDDLVLIHHDQGYLKECLIKIRANVEALGLRLNAKKTQIFLLKQGINFLGFKFKLTENGKVIRLLCKENIKIRKRKLRKYKSLVYNGKMTRDKANECYESWKAHAGKGNSYNLLKRMDEYYSNLWEE